MEDTATLLKKAHKGDKAARDILIQDNLGLVHSIVNRYCRRYGGDREESLALQGYEREDLVQIGIIGLMKAIDRFDDSLELKLSTYAFPMIMGEIQRFFRDDSYVKVSRTVQENGIKIRRFSCLFETEMGREPTLQEITEGTGIMREDVILAMEAERHPKSLYSPMKSEDGGELLLLERVQQEGDNTACGTVQNCGGDREKDRLINILLVRQLLGELPEKERQVIFLRFYENKTQTQVAKLLGSSQVKVSRMEKKIMQEMRKKVSEGNGSILW